MVTVPCELRSAARIGERPSRAAAVASRMRASPPWSDSRQPRPPHLQTGPAGSIWMCPMSPAQPVVPRTTSPPTTIPHAIVGQDLEDSKLGLLARIEEWIDVAQELFLTGLKVRIGSIEVMDGALQVLIRGTTLHGLPKLIQRARAALADIESILHELLQEGQDLRKYFRTDFGLLLELAHIKTKDGVL